LNLKNGEKEVFSEIKTQSRQGNYRLRPINRETCLKKNELTKKQKKIEKSMNKQKIVFLASLLFGSFLSLAK
jgi:hypothetical protein